MRKLQVVKNATTLFSKDNIVLLLEQLKTIEAIEEGRKIAHDPSAKGYKSMEELRKGLFEE